MNTSLMLNCAKKYLNFFLKKNPAHLIRQEMCVVSVICGVILEMRNYYRIWDPSSTWCGWTITQTRTGTELLFKIGLEIVAISLVSCK
jgi:hypothetical protein